MPLAVYNVSGEFIVKSMAREGMQMKRVCAENICLFKEGGCRSDYNLSCQRDGKGTIKIPAGLIHAEN